MNIHRCHRPDVAGSRWPNQQRWSALQAVLAVAALPALADEDAAVVYIRPVPGPVAAVTRCDETGPATTSRRIFSGFVVFTVECPVVRLNFRYEIVAADEMSGEGARRLTFPKAHPPNPDDPEDVLYNTDLLDNGEIAELFVDPEAVGIACRHVARWRLTGDAPAAKLVYWRETADCSGETGWTVLVGE
jgi:hypothetical protein